jgi:glycosyltransferase involved in cell wall biosynthesis
LHRKRIGLDGRALGNINRNRGIGRYTAQLIPALEEAGDRFQFVLFGYGSEPESDPEHGHLLDLMEWREIPRPRTSSPLTLTYEHLLFARTIQDAGVDLFHAIDHNMTPFLACPFMLTVHDLIPLIMRGPYLGPRAWLWMQVHRRAALKASMVVAVSDNTRVDIQRLWDIPGHRIEVIPEGVSDSYQPVEDARVLKDVAARYGIDGPYLLYLGGFDPRKNIHTTLLSFKRFSLEAGGRFRLVLCGDSSGFEGYLQDEIEELGLQGEVILTGFVPDRELPILCSGAALLVFLSLYEGFGLPLLEAMACGTPVLASNTSSIPEVVGDAGLLVDPLDLHGIVTGMQELAYNEKRRDMYIQRGLKRSANFTWRETARRVLGLYHRLLEGGGGSQG